LLFYLPPPVPDGDAPPVPPIVLEPVPVPRPPPSEPPVPLPLLVPEPLVPTPLELPLEVPPAPLKLPDSRRQRSLSRPVSVAQRELDAPAPVVAEPAVPLPVLPPMPGLLEPTPLPVLPPTLLFGLLPTLFGALPTLPVPLPTLLPLPRLPLGLDDVCAQAPIAKRAAAVALANSFKLMKCSCNLMREDYAWKVARPMPLKQADEALACSGYGCHGRRPNHAVRRWYVGRSCGGAICVPASRDRPAARASG